MSPPFGILKDVSVNVHNDHAACMLCTNNTRPMQTKQPDCTDLSLLSLHAQLIGTGYAKHAGFCCLFSACPVCSSIHLSQSLAREFLIARSLGRACRYALGKSDRASCPTVSFGFMPLLVDRDGTHLSDR